MVTWHPKTKSRDNGNKVQITRECELYAQFWEMDEHETAKIPKPFPNRKTSKRGVKPVGRAANHLSSPTALNTKYIEGENKNCESTKNATLDPMRKKSAQKHATRGRKSQSSQAIRFSRERAAGSGIETDDLGREVRKFWDGRGEGAHRRG
jgi:hypothetical protein